MSEIQGLPRGGDIQYRGKTFQNITHLVGKSDQPVNMDEMQVIDSSPEHCRAVARRNYHSYAVYPGNPGLTAVSQAINQERDEAIDSFLDGNLSGNGLADTFQQLLTRFRSACDEYDYPTPLGLDLYSGEAFAEAFYSDFRAKVLESVLQRNNEEGRQYLSGTTAERRNWKYYNSDYYFLSEDALAAVDEGLKRFLSGVGIKGFTMDIPDYKTEGMDHCYNFNSAWSAFRDRWPTEDQFMRDYDQVPPRDFQWFYQSGGNEGSMTLKFQSCIGPNGAKEVYENKHDHFDPEDDLSATTWAAYRDANGVRHVIGTDFGYDMSENDRKVVSSLLRFTGNQEGDAAANRFLNSLQVCSSGYYRRFGLGKVFDLHI